MNPGDQPIPFTAERLAWRDEDLGTIDFPFRPMKLRSSFGSGLVRRAGDPAGIVWGVGDRGPNIKPKVLVERYGLDRMEPLLDKSGAKVMPRVDLGPQIARLRVAGDRVELLETVKLCDQDGVPVSGLPIPGGDHARREPVFDLDGEALAPDPAGFDTEGIAATADGAFGVGDEFGPSLVRIDAGGRLLLRVVPEGVHFEDAPYPVRAALPPIAATRHLNRGFEALALSADERWLFLAFQSPLAHPDVDAHKAGRHVRIWRLDAETLEVAGQYLYPLDRPKSFIRDAERGDVDRSDVKVSELAWIGDDALLVLERVSHSTKIYRVRLDDGAALPSEHLDVATRPTVEELSGEDRLGGLVPLRKRLLFDSDHAPDVPADIEGMAILSPTELLLVNDNDFGVEGAKTEFWRIHFEEPVLA